MANTQGNSQLGGDFDTPLNMYFGPYNEYIQNCWRRCAPLNWSCSCGVGSLCSSALTLTQSTKS